MKENDIFILYFFNYYIDNIYENSQQAELHVFLVSQAI